MQLPREGQIYDHIVDSYNTWGEPTGTITEVLRIEEISNGSVKFRTGSHSGNLNKIETMPSKMFETEIDNKRLILVKDIPLLYVPPINRLDLVD